MDYSELVIFVVIEPKSTADRDNLAQGLQKLMAEDATFRVNTDTRTGETILRVMSEMQIEFNCDRLGREFNVVAITGKPRAAYKETLTRPAEGEGRYVRQYQGHGQDGPVKIRLLPGARGSGYVFENHIAGDAIPMEYSKAIDDGIRESLTSGVLRGYPVDDVRVELYDGSFHDADSSEMTFRMAGSMAFRDAAKKAGPMLLEPIMQVEVSVSEELIGSVIDDMNSRRGQVEGMELIGTTQIIRAKAPLSEMFGYASDVGFLTDGRGRYAMHFDRYELMSGDRDSDDEDRAAPVRAPRARGPKGRGSSVGIP